MTMLDAIDGAESAARECGLPVVLVREGIHADEFAELDDDGQSYGYCPAPSVSLLYKWGEVLKRVTIERGAVVWAS